MNLDDPWVAEYSASQDAFHVQPLETALMTNMERVRHKDKSNDWCLVAWGQEPWVRSVVIMLQAGQEEDPQKEMAAIGRILRQMEGISRPELSLIKGGKA
jgi:hypothetical protein